MNHVKSPRMRFLAYNVKGHLIFLFLSLCIPLCVAHSEPVSPQEAQKAADSWLSVNDKPLGSVLGHKITSIEAHDVSDTHNAYYIACLDPAGFLVVSTDDLIEPIIAFIPSGRFEPDLANPLGALVIQDLGARLRNVRANQAKAGGAVASVQGTYATNRGKWNVLLKGNPKGIASVSDERVSPFVQTHWSQSTVGNRLPCYNYYTPPYAAASPDNYVCGCAATAMAQLMRYFQYPIAAVGTPSFTIYVDGVAQNRSLRGGDGLGGPYKWSKMVTDPDGSETEEQRQAIGALTHDGGVAIKMNYTSTASGAQLKEVASQLTRTFGYSNAVWGVHYWVDALPPESFLLMINPNLDANLPVLLGIGGSHAIVCDGYGYNLKTLYHHLNLGWSGSSDAWYNLPTVDTADGYSFTTINECVFNIYTTGSGEIISGRVCDGDASPVVGVSVTATQTGGASRVATTNSRGIFSFAKVPSATQYTIAVSADGLTFASRVASTGTSTSGYSGCGNVWLGDIFCTMDHVTLTVNSAPDTGVAIQVTPPDRSGLADGSTSFSRAYDPNTTVSLQAPTIFNGRRFIRWAIQGTSVTNQTTSLGMDTSKTAEAVFADDPAIPGLISPEDGAMVPGDMISFSWEEAVGANRYNLQISEDPSFPDSLTNNIPWAYTSLELGGSWLVYGNTYYWRVKAGNEELWSAYSNPRHFTNADSAAPSITDHPQSLTVNPGASASFAVTATGTAPLSYQWKKDRTNVSGATAATYTIANAEQSHAGSYTCVVTNSAGSATSNAATLTVKVVPVITAHPASLTVNPGVSASFAVTATGTAPLSYQWKKDGTSISGATGATYTIASTQQTHEGSYTCVVTNSVGSATSNAATLTVKDIPVITVQPQSRTVNPGQSASFSVTATGTAPLSYQWKKDGTNVSGATAATYTIASVQKSHEGSYTCVIENIVGSIVSTPGNLTVLTSGEGEGEGEFTWGDLATAPGETPAVVCNGRVGGQDAVLVLKWYAGLIRGLESCPDQTVYQAPAYPPGSDVNGDGKLGGQDAAYILKYYAGIITCFPADKNCDGMGPEGGGEGEGEGESVVVPGEMVSVPEGTFTMGNSGRGDDALSSSSDELPQHQVTLSVYQIGKYLVTNKEYADILNWAQTKGYLKDSSGSTVYSGGYVYGGLDVQLLLYVTGPGCQVMYSGGVFGVRTRDGYLMALHPVVDVTWYGSVMYCNWLSESQGLTPCYDINTWVCDRTKNGYRLPTEAQWERAAAWDSASNKHWVYGFMSDTIDRSRCNTAYDDGGNLVCANPLGLSSTPYTSPVGWFNGLNISPNGNVSTVNSPSPAGCYDMSGNVWEWCNDWFDSGYYTACQSMGVVLDPQGATADLSRVLRGGSWYYNDFDRCRSAIRGYVSSPEGLINTILGFRVALTP